MTQYIFQISAVELDTALEQNDHQSCSTFVRMVSVYDPIYNTIIHHNFRTHVLGFPTLFTSLITVLE
jgi:hypothetical protein